MLESVAEADEELMMKFLEGEEITQVLRILKKVIQYRNDCRRNDSCDHAVLHIETRVYS